MYYSTLSLSFVYLLLLIIECKAEDLTPMVYATNPTDSDLSIDSTCGGKSPDASNSRPIIYKYQENYETNERCVWTIRSTNAYQYLLFSLVSANFSDPGDRIEIFGEGGPSGIERRLTLTQNSTGMSFRGGYTYALVLFKSDHAGIGTGFQLSYGRSYSDFFPIFVLGNHPVYNGASGYFEDYPLSLVDWENTTFFGAYTSDMLTPINLSIPSGGEPIVLVCNVRDYRSVSGLGLQVYWNMESVPPFNYTLGPTTTTTRTTGNDGGVGGSSSGKFVAWYLHLISIFCAYVYI